MSGIEKEIEICEGKLNTEDNKKIIGGLIYNNLKCEECEGYDIKCENYHPAPPWRGKD